MHWDKSAYRWIGRPRTPPHCPDPEDALDEDVRFDIVWPFHFEELTDSDAYAYALLARSREHRPPVSDSESE
jgi:hypothetical protein